MFYYFKNTEEALKVGSTLNMGQISRLLYSIEHFKKEILAIRKTSNKTKSIKQLNKEMVFATYYQLCVEALSVKFPMISLLLSK